MPFQLNPEVAAGLAIMFGDTPPPQQAVGDVKGRRQMLDGVFDMLIEQMPKVPDVEQKQFHTKAEDGHDILLRWFTKTGASQPSSAVLYAHGGGMICLNTGHYEPSVARYVSRTGVPFMMAEYRLAPEVRAPVPVTDMYAGLKYLVEHASELGVDPSRIAIMGDSAGGGISASLAHYIKQKGGPAVKKQILVYPMLDDRNVKEDPNLAGLATWSYDDNKTGWGALLGDKMGTDKVQPIEAAGRATVKDCEGLPPTYMDVGEIDLFRNEDIQYAATLGLAGVECEFHLYPGCTHAWEGMAPEAELSRDVMDKRCKVIQAL